MDEPILIVDLGNPIAADYVRHCRRQQRKYVSVMTARQARERVNGLAKQVVLFLAARWTNCHANLLERVIGVAREQDVRTICVVSTWTVHFEDRAAIRAERIVLRMLHGVAAQTAIVRPCHVLSPHSPLRNALRVYWFMLPFLPLNLKSCSIKGEELFAVIEKELSKAKSGKNRTYTLLGANYPWRARFLDNAPPALTGYLLALTHVLIPLSVFRQLLGWFFAFIAKRTTRLKPWHTETLYPRTQSELLALYNPYSYQHIKIVGYNNGAVHFGQRFPGKTVVSTVGCARRARAWGDRAQCDAGVIIRRVRDVLASVGKELHVLPNYSYVSLGTSFFVPIHGSASKYSTIAETIEKVVLYDPRRDRFLVVPREDPAFAESVYNLTSDLLLLRLVVGTKGKSSYFVHKQRLLNPSSQEIIAYLYDNQPTNVEIRKAGSRADAVYVYQYFSEERHGEIAALELPRDALGQLWDRLEENPITSCLFHWLTRCLAYHTELFLSEKDFARFWETHNALPIRKIQLRFIRRDGWPNSPFRDHDCISADLFLLKRHRTQFESYLKQTLPAARTNPGKHSM